MRVLASMTVLAGWLASGPPSAHAQVAPDHLTFEPCLAVDPVEVSRLLNIEIAARSTQASKRGALDIRLTGRCPAGGDVMVDLVGTDPQGQSVRAERHFDWQRVEPQARARLLAIGIAEMWPESPAHPDPASGAPRSVASATPLVDAIAKQSPGAVSDAPSGWVHLGAGVAFFSRGSPGSMLKLQAGRRVSQRAGVGLTLDVLRSSSEVEVGATAIGDAVLHSVAGGPMVFVEARGRRCHARAQAGFAGGIASLSGRSNVPASIEGRSVLGFWGGPQSELATGFTLGRGWDLELWLHAAYNLTAIRGRVVDGATETRGGPWYAAGLGFGRRFF